MVRKITAQKMKFFIKDYFSKCDQIHSFLQIWSYLLKKSLMENFIFCAVSFLASYVNQWGTKPKRVADILEAPGV